MGLELLFTGRIREITINDMDRSVYAFWKSVMDHPDELCQKIHDTAINLRSWNDAKSVQANKKRASIIDLGFSTFFLNRTNYSGVIMGGIMGGKSQHGPSKMDCRFNKDELIRRIMRIAERKDRIHVHNKDAMDLVEHPPYRHAKNNTLYYFDPPYYSKGAYLYMNHYGTSDHWRISEVIKKMLQAKWIVSYDNVDEITRHYSGYERQAYTLYHTARSFRIGREIMFFSRNLDRMDEAITEIPNRVGAAA